MELSGSDAESHAFGLYHPFCVWPADLDWYERIGACENDRIPTPINLDVSDEQIGVEQAGVTGELKWDQIWKVVRIPNMYIIKVGPTNGYLVPFRSIEGRKQEFVDFCKRNLPPKKTKGLKA